MQVGGVQKRVDWERLGPTLVIASSLVLAIRTARWPLDSTPTASQLEWDAEVEHSVRLAKRVLSHLLAKTPGMFVHKDVPWYQATDDDVVS